MNIQYFQYFQYVSLLIALVYFKSSRHFKIELLFFLILVACITETIGSFYSLFPKGYNDIAYNLYLPVSEILQFGLFLRMLHANAGRKKILQITAGLCFVFTLSDLFFIQGVYEFNTYSAILCQMINIVFCCLILLELAMNEKEIIIFYKEPYFWIASANLLFSLGALFVLGSVQFIRLNNIKVADNSIYTTVMGWLNVILYSALSYAIILCQVRRKALSS